MVEVRPATPEDVPAIAAFTADTFEWGDYVAEALPGWLADPDGAVFVAVHEDAPIAMARGTMLSPTEAWFHAARVHPDHRGKGIAGTLAHVLMAWAKDRGATVGRLLIEDWNEPSKRHVAKIGMRPVARFIRAVRAVGEASPRPTGNGGRAHVARTRLLPSAEAPAAYTSWAAGPLATAARELFARGWSLRRLRPQDLEAAAQDGSLWAVGSGWVIVRPEERVLEVGWVETSPDEAGSFVRGLGALAEERGKDELVLWLPDVPWLVQAARRAGAEARTLWVYAIAL